MSEASVETLFDEFALAYVRGEQPDVGEFLARAAEGTERDDLAGLIDRFLAAVPAREPSEEEIVLMQARLQSAPPLLVLRLRRKLSRAAVVDALMRRLGLDPEKRDKVRRYYSDLEVGVLDPAPVSPRVWDALSDFLQANVRALADLRLPPLAAKPAFRAADASFTPRVLTLPSAQPKEGPDEVDSLFLGPDEP